jgi:hypothetical protein
METLLTACRLQVQVRGREAGVPLTGGGLPRIYFAGSPNCRFPHDARACASRIPASI